MPTHPGISCSVGHRCVSYRSQEHLLGASRSWSKMTAFRSHVRHLLGMWPWSHYVALSELSFSLWNGESDSTDLAELCQDGICLCVWKALSPVTDGQLQVLSQHLLLPQHWSCVVSPLFCFQLKSIDFRAHRTLKCFLLVSSQRRKRRPRWRHIWKVETWLWIPAHSIHLLTHHCPLS
jgi:hypothetical protein